MDIDQTNEALTSYVRPQSMPLAVRMCESVEELPERVRIPGQDLGFKIATCQGISMARRYGWTLAIGRDDLTCPLPGLAMGFLPPKDGYLDGSFMESQGFGSREAQARTAQALPKLEYGNPAQVLVMLGGRLHGEGGSLNFTAAEGMSCIFSTVTPILTGECQVVLPGVGERINAMSTPDEMAFAIPASKVEHFVDGLAAGYRLGVLRYPTPTWLRFQPQHPPYLTKLLEYLTEDD